MAQIIEPGSTVLDVGCGEGLLLEYLTKNRAIKGYGVDISHEAAKLAETRGIVIKVTDILAWEIEEKYDYIILSEVIEHLANSEQVIVKLSKHFRKAMIVSVPNIGYYQHRLRLLFGRFPIQWNWHPSEHLRFWTVVDFKAWIQELGLAVVKVESSNGLPLLHRYLPNLFGNQVVFIIHSTDYRHDSEQPV
jgi:methionine biosynthesis protein MetW